MTDPGQEDLLGYLLGALDPDEQRRVEDALERSPALRLRLDELAKEVAPLDDVDQPELPPIGLARRTCEIVAHQAAFDAPEQEETPATEPAEQSASVGAFGSVIEARKELHARRAVKLAETSSNSSRKTSSTNNPSRSKRLSQRNDVNATVGSSSWSASELTIAASACLILGLLFFPALANSRHRARITACQDNLRQIGYGLQTYSQLNRGYLPQVSLTGNLSVAGAYAPQLRDMGLVSRSTLFICPSSSMADARTSFDLPSCGEIEALEDTQAWYWQKRMGGSYAYSMGYVSNGAYHPHINRGRPNFVILADAPDLSDSGRTSRNHGGQGQNVVCEDMSIRYLKDCMLCGCDSGNEGDLFFVNRNGVVAAGVDENDSVVGPSEASPIVPYFKMPASAQE